VQLVPFRLHTPSRREEPVMTVTTRWHSTVLCRTPNGQIVNVHRRHGVGGLVTQAFCYAMGKRIYGEVLSINVGTGTPSFIPHTNCKWAFIIDSSAHAEAIDVCP
jgi:hypothetical protein